METSVVNLNKERLFLQIRNKVGIDFKVFISENIL